MRSCEYSMLETLDLRPIRLIQSLQMVPPVDSFLMQMQQRDTNFNQRSSIQKVNGILEDKNRSTWTALFMLSIFQLGVHISKQEINFFKSTVQFSRKDSPNRRSKKQDQVSDLKDSHASSFLRVQATVLEKYYHGITIPSFRRVALMHTLPINLTKIKLGNAS